MRHPTEGVLRRLLDEPAGVADPDREHIADCAVCLGALAQVREDAAAVDAALRADFPQDVDLASAWSRLSAALPDHGPARTATTTGTRRRAALLRRPVVAVVAVVAVLTGAGVAAANDWLPIFRTEQIAPVSVRAADPRALPDPTAYGGVQMTGQGDPHQVADTAAAQRATGLPAPEVGTLPRGVSGQPVYQVVGMRGGVFSSGVARATQPATAPGQPPPPVPAGLDGSQ